MNFTTTSTEHNNLQLNTLITSLNISIHYYHLQWTTTTTLNENLHKSNTTISIETTIIVMKRFTTITIKSQQL